MHRALLSVLLFCTFASAASNSTNGTATNGTAVVTNLNSGRGQGGHRSALEGRGRGGGRGTGLDDTTEQQPRVVEAIPLPKGPPPKSTEEVDAEIADLKDMLPEHLWEKYGVSKQAKAALLRGGIDEVPTYEG